MNHADPWEVDLITLLEYISLLPSPTAFLLMPCPVSVSVCLRALSTDVE